MKSNKINQSMPRAYFNHGYAHMLMYLRNHQEADIPEEMIMKDGFPLGKWLMDVRQGLKYNQFTEKQKAMLEALGISRNKEMQCWESMYLKLEDYYLRNGDVAIRHNYCTEDGVLLGAWLDRQKRYYVTLEKEQQEKLRRLGIGSEYGD